MLVGRRYCVDGLCRKNGLLHGYWTRVRPVQDSALDAATSGLPDGSRSHLLRVRPVHDSARDAAALRCYQYPRVLSMTDPHVHDVKVHDARQSAWPLAADQALAL